MRSIKFIGSALLFVSLNAFAGGPDVAIDVGLSPAGGFKAQTTKVSGVAHKTADGIAAENVIIDLRSLTTGIALRDKHTKEHLLVDKFPQAKLVKASGKDGKGEATIQVAGKTQTVHGTYTIEGNMVHAVFPMDLSKLDINNVKYMGIGVKNEVTVNLNLPLQAGVARATASAKKK